MRRANTNLIQLPAICILLLLTISACNMTTDQDKDKQFLAQVDTNPITGVSIVTEHSDYQSGDSFGYVVINKTGLPLYFSDQSLGLRVYQYDDLQKKWMQIHTTYKVGFPKGTTVPPISLESELPTYGFGLEQLGAKGKIRLAAFGWTDPTNPEKSSFVVWKDIEIR